jgi:uncharacterized C2H2 Zn-finger protein
MIFPDQSPVVLIALVVALLAMALFAAARDLLSGKGGELACPRCGLAFDAQRWARHNQRTMYHGRYTVTPHYTCPRCGESVRQNSA